jgi:hypothetical protein
MTYQADRARIVIGGGGTGWYGAVCELASGQFAKVPMIRAFSVPNCLRGGTNRAQAPATGAGWANN